MSAALIGAILAYAGLVVAVVGSYVNAYPQNQMKIYAFALLFMANVVFLAFYIGVYYEWWDIRFGILQTIAAYVFGIYTSSKGFRAHWLMQ